MLIVTALEVVVERVTAVAGVPILGIDKGIFAQNIVGRLPVESRGSFGGSVREYNINVTPIITVPGTAHPNNATSSRRS